MLDISIRGKKYNCDITLEHKISIFLGDSGVGKSLFVKAITDESGAFKLTLSDNYKIILLTGKTWFDILSANTSNKDNKLFIIDDEDFILSKEFGEMYSKITAAYFIFIVRTNILESDLTKWNGLSISANAIYEFVKDGNNHNIALYKYPKVHEPNNIHIDLCLCEDKKSGFIFFKRIFKNIVSSDGKDNILKYIKENKKLFSSKVIFLVVDYAAIGFKLNEICEYLKLLNCKVYFSSKYESFEYLLLKSNFFKIDDSDIMVNILNYASLEEKCTFLIKDLTKGKIYAYDKGSVPLCYTEDCCKMNRSKLQCDKGMSGDKINAMLIDTDFEFFLSLRQV